MEVGARGRLPWMRPWCPGCMCQGRTLARVKARWGFDRPSNWHEGVSGRDTRMSRVGACRLLSGGQKARLPRKRRAADQIDPASISTWPGSASVANPKVTATPVPVKDQCSGR